MEDDIYAQFVEIDKTWKPKSISQLGVDWVRAGEKVFEPRVRVCFATDYLISDETENHNEEDT